VSVVAVTPEDRWEVARPESGLTLRIRCAWQNTTQGQPKTPIAEFVKLLVDGQPAKAQLKDIKRARGVREDYYHEFHLPNPAPGLHTAIVSVRILETGEEVTRTTTFTV
jgi:hypothetical protein